MDVLFITHYTELLGANRSMLQLILELRERGVNPTVLMPFSKNIESEGLKEVLNHNSIKYIEAPIRQIKHPYFSKIILNYLYSQLLNLQIVKQLKDYKFDIIHSNSSVINIGSCLSKKLKIKHVWHLREFGDLDYNMKTPFCKCFQRIIYRGNNNFVAISQKIRHHFLPYVKSQNIHLIYNGIVAQEEKEKDYNCKLEFCIVGFISEKKGQYDVVKAVDYLVNYMEIKNFHVTVVGDGYKEHIEQIKRFIIKNNLNSYITFTGYQDNVSSILNKMHVGIMASRNEAFGRVTVEYMMNGLAVIASDGGANQEIVENGKSGIIYHAGDFSELAKIMKYFIQDNKSVKSIAKEGYRVALSNFSSHMNATKIFNLYSSILNSDS